MFKKVGMDMCPHRVKNEIYALSTREFRSWDKITIARNEDDLIHLFLVGK